MPALGTSEEREGKERIRRNLVLIQGRNTQKGRCSLYWVLCRAGHEIESTDFEVQQKDVQLSALSLTSEITLTQIFAFLNLSFITCKMGPTNATHLIGLWGECSERMNLKMPAHSLC